MSGSNTSIPGKLRTTAIHDWHVAHGARMVDFAGFSMPVQYSTIVAEHQAVRNSAGMFDVSHMGRLEFKGKGAREWLDKALTCRLFDLAVGQVRYSLVCDGRGGVLDDVLVTRWEDSWGLVVNASNHAKVKAWLKRHQVADATCDDITSRTVMVAVQGPDWWRGCQGLLPESVLSLAYFRADPAVLAGQGWRVSRTGYTGEDGVEIIAPAEAGVSLVEALWRNGVTPCGLGARDTLRLEAAMPLYGHELNENTDPFQAGLGRSVDMEKEFLGKEALAARKGDDTRPVRVGIALEGRRATRQGDLVLDAQGLEAGRVTSGTYSPTLERPVAMAYVRRDQALAGTPVTLVVRESRLPGKVCPLPFYKRTKKA